MRLFENLTDREEEVLALIADGHENKVIASTLCISIFTVQNHVQNLLKRMEVRNRTQAAGKYWQRFAQSQFKQDS
jgi:DNA-binding NarL/FixJ family response regulator